MRDWRAARVTKEMTLHVDPQPYWTKKGAQAAATHLNTTFGAMANFAGTLLGHNYFATNVAKIPQLERALELSRNQKK